MNTASPRQTSNNKTPNIVTPGRTNNPYQALDVDDSSSDNTSADRDTQSVTVTETIIDQLPDLTQNPIAVRITAIEEDKDSSDEDSIMTTKTDSTIFGDESLQDRMERRAPGITKTVKGKDTYVNVLHFRKIMGDALTEINCSRHSLGYSGLIDSEHTHKKRMGNVTAEQPVMPTRPPYQGDETNKDIRRVYENKLKYYLACEQVRLAGIKALEAKYPGCLELLYDEELGMLSEDTTLIECMEHVIDAVDTIYAKRELLLELRKEIQSKADNYQHIVGADSCIPFFKQMGSIKTDIDALNLVTGQLTVEELIMYCQQGLRGGVGTRKEAITNLDKKWKAKLLTLQKRAISDNKIWLEFKIFYTKGIRQKEEDGELIPTNNRGKAKSAMIEEVQLLREQLDEQAADQYAFETRMEEKYNSAMSVITEASRRSPPVPPSIPDGGSTTPSTLTDTQTQRYQALIDSQNERIRKLEAQLQQNRSKPQHKDPLVECKDNTGRKWYQIIYYCSTHGWNHSHRNCNCENKGDQHNEEATEANPMGVTKNEQYKNWWCSGKASNRKYAKDKPN